MTKNEYNLEESSLLQFGAELSSAVRSIYDAISYVLKKSKQTHRLPESIKLAAGSVKLFWTPGLPEGVQCDHP